MAPLRNRLPNRRPDPVPVPVPPSPEPAEAQPPRDVLPLTGHDLPAVPLRRGDMPADAKPHLGRLVSSASKTGRPLVGVLVSCPKCKRLHRYPWRWDWGLSPDVVSRQGARCPGKGAGKPTWVALDPTAETENAATHAAAHEAFEVWEAARLAKKAARAAATEPPSTVPDTNPESH